MKEIDCDCLSFFKELTYLRLFVIMDNNGYKYKRKGSR